MCCSVDRDVALLDSARVQQMSLVPSIGLYVPV